MKTRKKRDESTETYCWRMLDEDIKASSFAQFPFISSWCLRSSGKEISISWRKSIERKIKWKIHKENIFCDSFKHEISSIRLVEIWDASATTPTRCKVSFFCFLVSPADNKPQQIEFMLFYRIPISIWIRKTKIQWNGCRMISYMLEIRWYEWYMFEAWSNFFSLSRNR